MPFGGRETLVSELTDLRHRETRSHIAATAVALFQQAGFDETTMADVADASGVSRRTVYRHFPNKQDLIFEVPRQWHAQFREMLAARAEDETARDFTRRAILDLVAKATMENPETVVAGYSLVLATPSLHGAHGRTDAESFALYAEALTQGLAPDAVSPLEVATAAGALVGAVNALLSVWVQVHEQADLMEMATAVLDQIDSIWPDAVR